MSTDPAWPAPGLQYSEAFWTNNKDRFTKGSGASLWTNTQRTNTRDNQGRTQYSTTFAHHSGRDRTNLNSSFIHALTDHQSSLVLGLSPFPITLNSDILETKKCFCHPERKGVRRTRRTLGICNTEPRNTC